MKYLNGAMKKLLATFQFSISSIGQSWKIGYLGNFSCFIIVTFKDTYREKAPTNKTPAPTESMNTDIWAVGTSIKLFKAGSYTETKFPKK